MPAVGDLERGRESWARGEWRAAYELLASAHASAPLGAEDLELLATAAYMRGRDPEYLENLERAHQARLDAGETRRATLTAFWLGMQLMLAGETGRGSGWLGRAQRLLEQEPDDCVERGYLMLPRAFQREAAGDLDGGAAIAADAAAAAERFGDRDLLALSMHLQGHLLIAAGRVPEGLGLLDEAMVVLTSDELSPIVCGIVYCGVILSCQEAYDPRRAQEWTAALARWCERQPEMVSFSGRCHVHRAEIMHLQGAWSDALDEARRASARAAEGNHRGALAEAAYVQGEVHRLRGRPGPAEEAYREASRYGRDPQPGLALLRLAQGDVDAAAVAIRRALSENSEGPKRARLLPACAEIMVAAGDLDAATGACDELAEIAGGRDVGVLGAIVAQTRGALDLAAGDPGAALAGLRQAWRVWEEIDAPYEAARVRELIGAACRALGDGDAAGLELEAARRAFEELGAPVDVARVDALAGGGGGLGAAGAGGPDGLTPRELEVLRLVAAGQTNKAIADELVLSRRTVDRHVSNIFAKLRVSSRAAATAYAYEHKLV
jgi:ATP/maltotriose-dependent transcriptional regulator MalT